LETISITSSEERRDCSVMNVYQRAWKLLLTRLEQKTGWGKEELKKLMLQCLLDAGDEDDQVSNSNTIL